jgi:WD repeat-containing protein 70
VATGNPQAKIYTRDGFEEGVCVKGDMYLADMKNTKGKNGINVFKTILKKKLVGHVGSLGNAQFHPTDKEIFLTSGSDGTARIWDVYKMNQCQKHVIKVKQTNAGKKIPVNCTTYDALV